MPILSIGSIVPISNPILFGHVKKIEKVCPASRSTRHSWNSISCPRDHLCIIAQTRSWLAMYRCLDCSYAYVTCLWNSLHHLVDHYLIIFTVIVPSTNHLQKSRLVIKCLDFLPPWHIVWKSPKMSHLNFGILAFSTNFCPFKTDLSSNSVWPQASGFHKLAKMDHFWHF